MFLISISKKNGSDLDLVVLAGGGGGGLLNTADKQLYTSTTNFYPKITSPEFQRPTNRISLGYKLINWWIFVFNNKS